MRKIGFLVLALVILIPYFSMHSSIAQSDRAQPTGRIESTYELKFINLSKIELSATLSIYKIMIVSSLFTADAIRENYTENVTLAEALKSEINSVVNNVLNTTFANDNITTEEPIVDNSSLSRALINTGLPVNLTKKGTITFNETSFGFKQKLNLSDLDEVLRGLLSAGARINKTFELSAEPGYKNKFLLIAPEGVFIKSDDEDNSNKTATWTIDNLNGTTKKLESKILSLESPIAPHYNENKILAFVTIDFYRIDIFKFACYANLNFSASFHWMHWIERFEGFERHIPKNVAFDWINADLIRLFLAKNIIERTDLDNFIEENRKRLEENLSSAAGENVTLVAYIDNESLERYNVTNMSGERAIEIMGYAEFEFKLKKEGNITKGTELVIFEGLVRIPLNFTLQGIERFNTTFKLILPPRIKIFELHDTLGRAKKGSEKGRDYCELWLKGNENNTIDITLDLTPFIINFVLPFIMIGVILGVAGLVIKIISWREERFIGKTL